MSAVPGRALRILVVSNVFAPQHIGGAEVVALRQAKRLAALGHDVEVLAGWVPGLHSDEPPPEFQDGLRVHRVPFSGWDQSVDFHVPSTGRVLAELLEKRPADIVHFHNLRGMGVNLIAEARRHGARTVVTLHDNWGHCLWGTRLRPDGSFCTAPEECALACAPSVAGPGGRLLPQRLRRDAIAHALEGADQLISPSQALAGFYANAGFRRESIRVISNGIDLSHFERAEGVGQAPLRFSFIASLAPHKGLRELLRAASMLDQDVALRGRWALDIIGEGGMRAEAEEWVSRHGLGHCVRIVGRVERSGIPALLRQSSVVVLPSIWPENEPLVLLEAVASGLAQIATSGGGNVELVDEGRSGLLVPPRDAEALARAMAALIISPELAARQGAYNWARRERYDEERSIEALLGVYTEVLGRGAPSRRPTVYCMGESVPETARAICDNAFRFEDPKNSLRLIWQGWAEPGEEADSVIRWNMEGALSATEETFQVGRHGVQAAYRALGALLPGAECALATRPETAVSPG